MRSWILAAMITAGLTGALPAQELTDPFAHDRMPGWHVRRRANDRDDRMLVLDPAEAGTWTLSNGTLYCNGGGTLWGEWLGTDRDYTDVLVEFDYKVPPDGNSGLYLRTPMEGHPSSVSFEIQLLDDDAEKHRSLQPDQFTGSIYKIVAPARRAARPAGQWNHMRVIARADHLTVVLNGETVVDVDGRIAPEILRRSPRGGVGFQNHHVPAWFRNVRIADLADEPVPRWPSSALGAFLPARELDRPRWIGPVLAPLGSGCRP
jgi:hypothetical protein